MTPAIDASLSAIADAARHFADEWWILGSAAAALVGAEIEGVRDVDLLLSEADARALLALWSHHRIEPAPASDQFRSRVFARFVSTPAPIEAIAGFEMRVAGVWRPVHPRTRLRAGAVFVPSVSEQIELMKAMGRAKDAPRLAALERIVRS